MPLFNKTDVNKVLPLPRFSPCLYVNLGNGFSGKHNSENRNSSKKQKSHMPVMHEKLFIHKIYGFTLKKKKTLWPLFMDGFQLPQA